MFSLILAAIATNAPAIGGAAAITGINWTAILSVLLVCVTAMATIIQIFKPSKGIKDEVLRESEYIKEIHEESKSLKKAQEETAKELIASQSVTAKDLKDRQENRANELKMAQEEADKEIHKAKEELIEKVNHLMLEIERAKLECGSNTKSIEELKKDYRILASRLDELLKQILEWFST